MKPAHKHGCKLTMIDQKKVSRHGYSFDGTGPGPFPKPKGVKRVSPKAKSKK